MEKFGKLENKNQPSNYELRESIEAQIIELEEQSSELEQQLREILSTQFQGNPDDAEMRGIFEERKMYELQRLDSVRYDLNTKISGLKFQLSRLEENN